MPDYGEELIAELMRSDCWPLKRERRARAIVAERRALRKGDRPELKTMARWHQHTKEGVERDYVVDPLARRIAGGFADFLFGEDPTFLSDGYQDDLDQVVKENNLPARLHRGERMVVSEGEGYWKLHVNKEIAPCALIEFRSRLSVVPLFYGDRMLACAFVSEVARETGPETEGDENPAEIVWRHAEVHCDGVVRNLLFRGFHDRLGDKIGLSAQPRTAAMLEEWHHELPMLAGRVVNDLEDDDTLGEGEYDQVRDLLLALNEAATIAVENARLTGKDRIFVAGRFTDISGGFDASMEVFQLDKAGATLGESEDKPPVYAVEKTYDADPLWLHITKLVHTILSRVGLVAKFIGDATEGGVDASGRSIRLQFMPTTNAAKGKGREWDGKLPMIADLMLRVGALSVEKGGFGRTYKDAGLPSVSRGDVLPVDEGETITDNATAVTAEIRSRRTAIRETNPDWSEQEIEEELDRIRSDSDLSLPSPAGQQ